MRRAGRMPALGRARSLVVALASLALGCDGLEPTRASPPTGAAPAGEAAVAAPAPAPECQNDAIPSSPAILVVVPHPDDETLGFAGPIYAAADAGRRVRVVVATDGQAYCGACKVWKNGAPRNEGEISEPCTLRELVVFGHVRRRETLAAMAVLGLGPRDVTFLGYVDGSLEAAWQSPQLPPALPECVEEGEVPGDWLDKTGERLAEDLERIVQEEAAARVVFTTDPRDTHTDHSTLHAFVARALRETGGERELFTALIHRAGPGPCLEGAAAGSGCALPQRNERDAEAAPFSEIRERSYEPETHWEAQEDDFGPPLRFCLRPELYQGPEPLKRRAIERYETQIGVRDRFGTPLPPVYQGWVDWSGWLLRFVRRDELLYRSSVLAAGAPTAPAPKPVP
ncbi:MAG: PIG-L family deacetylase [Myxococcota bacterium]